MRGQLLLKIPPSGKYIFTLIVKNKLKRLAFFVLQP